jgi:4-amino-4-deoxy-L-arabinose transferase-like glycosyltransferase
MIATEALTARLEWILMRCAVLAAVVFIVVGITRPVWLDEANSVLIAKTGFAGIVDGLSRENNFPLYYFVLSVWMRLFGDSEIAVRSLSAIFYLGGCAAAFAVTRRLAGESRSGWYGALFYALSPLAIRQAQNIRMYALLGMLCGWSVWCWLRVIRDRDESRGAWICLVAVDLLGMLTHVWFAFVLVGQFAATVIFERRRVARFVLAVAAAAVPWALLWGIIFWGQLHNGATDWMPPLSPALVMIALAEFYGPLGALVLFSMALFSAAIAGFGKYRRAGPPLVIFVVSVAAPLAISAVKPIYWPGRYLIIALPPLAAVLGSILSERNRPATAIAVLLLMGTQVTAHISKRNENPDASLPPGQSDRATAQFLLAHASAGDAVVFTSLTRAAADYYFHQAGAGRRFREFSFPADTATHLGWTERAVTKTRREALDAESAQLVTQLLDLARAGKTIWVYDGPGEVRSILLQRMEVNMSVRRAYPLEGPYHKRIVEFGAAL